MIPSTFRCKFFQVDSNPVRRVGGLDQPRALRVYRVVSGRVCQPAFRGIESEKKEFCYQNVRAGRMKKIQIFVKKNPARSKAGVAP